LRLGTGVEFRHGGTLAQLEDDHGDAAGR
jgi:hypothetical protein